MKEDIKKLGWDAQLLHRQHNQEDITESFFRQEIRKLAEQYAKQRVIEELERIPNLKTPLGEEIRLSYHYVLKRIKELKQQI